jgi:hypothetical protein
MFGLASGAGLVFLALVNQTAPETVLGNLNLLVFVLVCLFFALITLTYVGYHLNRSRHHFWANFRILAGILLSAWLMIK